MRGNDSVWVNCLKKKPQFVLIHRIIYDAYENEKMIKTMNIQCIKKRNPLKKIFFLPFSFPKMRILSVSMRSIVNFSTYCWEHHQWHSCLIRYHVCNFHPMLFQSMSLIGFFFVFEWGEMSLTCEFHCYYHISQCSHNNGSWYSWCDGSNDGHWLYVINVWFEFRLNLFWNFEALRNCHYGIIYKVIH